MSIGSILLRLLLSLTLLMNGVAPAMAGQRSETATPALARVVAMHGTSASAMPCNRSGTAMPVSHTRSHALATGHGKPHADAMPDCCKTGSCDCACNPIAPLLAAAHPVASPAPLATALPAPDPLRAAPALPHLIRPPIA